MPAPLEVFCCYAREDQEMLEHLKKHLMPLQRSNQITIWGDTNLTAGVEWEKELHKHLESADLILLLISPDFMDSDYCYRTEMKRAIERHDQGSAVVIPILLRATLWRDAPFAKLQVLPKDGKPVRGKDWFDTDEAFNTIVEQINELISEWPTQRAQFNVSGYHGEPQKRVFEQPKAAYNLSLSPSFDPARLVLLRTLNGHTSGVAWVVFSPNGKILVSSSDRDDAIKLWKLPSGRELCTLTGNLSPVWDMAISPDGKILASSYADNTIRLWKLPSGRELRTLTTHTSHNYSTVIAISPNSKILASCDSDIKLWELPSGRELCTLIGDTGSVRHMAISPDGKTLAGNFGSVIKLWELSSGRELLTLTNSGETVQRVAFSPNGEILASSYADNTIKLWKLPSGRKLRTLTLTGHTSDTGSIAISPDSKILASGNADCIKLWELPSGRELRTLPLTSQTDYVWSVAFSPDGKTLASGGSDVKLWGTNEAVT